MLSYNGKPCYHTKRPETNLRGVLYVYSLFSGISNFETEENLQNLLFTKVKSTPR